MNPFCTISTQSHLFKAFALADSLSPFDATLFVLLTDNPTCSIDEMGNVPANVKWVKIDQLDSECVSALLKKFPVGSDAFRWGLKSVLLTHLCTQFDAICYVDNDVFFLNNPEKIFEKFENHKIVLTPHFYPTTPEIQGANWFEANFQVGIYNAGFIGVRKDAVDFLSWWFNACLYGIQKSYFRGLFDDQKYLDLVPAIFQPVFIQSLPTWNFAAWNAWYPGVAAVENKLLIENDPVLFIHFATLSLTTFSDPNHVAYRSYTEYIQVIDKYAPGAKAEEPTFSKRKVINYLRYLIWRILKSIQK